MIKFCRFCYFAAAKTLLFARFRAILIICDDNFEFIVNGYSLEPAQSVFSMNAIHDVEKKIEMSCLLSAFMWRKKSQT